MAPTRVVFTADEYEIDWLRKLDTSHIENANELLAELEHEADRDKGPADDETPTGE